MALINRFRRLLRPAPAVAQTPVQERGSLGQALVEAGRENSRGPVPRGAPATSPRAVRTTSCSGCSAASRLRRSPAERAVREFRQHIGAATSPSVPPVLVDGKPLTARSGSSAGSALDDAAALRPLAREGEEVEPLSRHEPACPSASW